MVDDLISKLLEEPENLVRRFLGTLGNLLWKSGLFAVKKRVRVIYCWWKAPTYFQY